jgi:hypothetical protein
MSKNPYRPPRPYPAKPLPTQNSWPRAAMMYLRQDGKSEIPSLWRMALLFISLANVPVESTEVAADAASTTVETASGVGIPVAIMQQFVALPLLLVQTVVWVTVLIIVIRGIRRNRYN